MKMSISDVCNNHTHTTHGLVENRVQLRDKDSGDLSVEEAGVVTSVADHWSLAVWRIIYENILFFSYDLNGFGRSGGVDIAPTPDAPGSSARPLAQTLQKTFYLTRRHKTTCVTLLISDILVDQGSGKENKDGFGLLS